MERVRPRFHPPAVIVLLTLASLLVGAPSFGTAKASSESPAATPGPGLWAARYNGPLDSLDLAEDIAVSPDGSMVAVTGTVDYLNDQLTIAYDTATGAERWLARHDGQGHGTDWATGLVITPDGSLVIVTGYGDGGFTENFETVALDAATGEERWTAGYDGGSHMDDEAYDIDVTPDGTAVVVTGSSDRPDGTDYATVAYDTTTGTQLWVSRYAGPADGAEANAVAVSPDGSMVFVTGESQGPGTDADFATIAYHRVTGAELWVSRYNRKGASEDEANALAVSPDGNTVAVIGDSTLGLYTDSDIVLLAYDAATGAERWDVVYSGSGGHRDLVHDVAVSLDGSMIVLTGSSNTGQDLEMLTAAYDSATGAQRWLSLYGGSGRGDSGGNGLALSPDGHAVIVAGYSVAVDTGYDFATVEFDSSTGALIRVARAGRQGHDAGEAIVVSPDGSKVFVAGNLDAVNGYADYSTVAYER